MVNEAKKADPRSDAKIYGIGLELLAKRAFAGQEKQRIPNICSCEGAKKINGPLPRLQFRAEKNNSVIR